MKRVAFVCFNHKDRYSGGRMHALYLALAFAKIGYEVDFYTNAKPIFYDDIVSLFGEDHFHIVVNKYFLWRKKHSDYNHIVFPPHVGRRKFADVADKMLIYPFLKKLKKKCSAKLWLLDFESPEWKAVVDNSVMYGYRNVIDLAKDIDIILSTTKTGMDYAKKFYGRLNPNLLYKQLYLCVNSSVANKFGYNMERKNCAVVFYRTGEAHKNNEAISNMIKSLPNGYILLLIGRINENDEAFLNKLHELGKQFGITIEQESKVSEKRKYEILSTSRLLFFSSKFEGYGLPPIEAQYVGTPVICSKLPVLKEVNECAVFADYSNLEELKGAVKQALLSDCKVLHDKVSSFASIEAFCCNLLKITDNIDNIN